VALAFTVLPAPAPIGALTVGVTDAGLVLVAFGAHPDAARRAASRLGEPLVTDPAAGAAATSTVRTQLAEYLTGERRHFDLPLDWRLTGGSAQRVLRALWETVPFGATVTYGELATRGGLGRGHTAARGVGAIMGSNPLPVVVPCHRVLASDGLGGFGGGRRTKEWLLALEGVLTGALPW
jgi:methylated-DNA-[protein]-cysteine S-methyltransferase